jgi:hypothetical protein
LQVRFIQLRLGGNPVFAQLPTYRERKHGIENGNRLIV